jgi:hypothetical protein
MAYRIRSFRQSIYLGVSYMNRVLITFFVAVFAIHEQASAGPVQWKIEDGGNGHWYELVMPESYLNSLTWTEAKALAESSGGYLATVTSQEENDFLESQFASQLFDNGGEGTPPQGSTYAWIGLYSPTPNSDFQWVTGEPLSYLNWAPGEPSLFGTDQWQYVHYWTRSHFGSGPSWLWNNDDDQGFEVMARQNNYGYIVEIVPEPSSVLLMTSGAIAMLWISTKSSRSHRRRVSRALALLGFTFAVAAGTANAAPIVSGIPIPPNDEGVTTDLFDVAQGTVVTASSAVFPGFDPRSAFGYNSPTAIESSRVIFSDSPTATDFIEFQTVSPVNLVGYRLILGEDIGTAKRSAQAFRLYAGADSGSLQLVSSATIEQTYLNQYGSVSVGITDTLTLQNVQTFRLELDRTSIAGFSGPRLIELDGFGVVVPEPATWTLGMLGTGALLLHHRLKRRKAA